MEFVPYEFCDSVVLLTNPKKLAEIENLAGYWSEAVQNPANRHSDVELTVIPVDGDHWKCYLSDWNTHHIISNWEGLSAANSHCLVLSAVEVTSCNSSAYKTVSPAELTKLLVYCYRRPLEVDVHSAPNQQWTQIMKLFENFDISRIELRYKPGYRQFLVRTLASQHLVGVHISNADKIPASLHPHIQEWARRVEFDELNIETRKHQFEFSVFEKLMRRIEGGHARCLPSGRFLLYAHFSVADCEKIMNFLGTSGLISTYKIDDYEVRRWRKENMSIAAFTVRHLRFGGVTCYHEDA